MTGSTPPAHDSGLRGRLTALFRTTQVQRILGVALGAASAQAVLLLASPVLTRLYTPEDFGVYSYFYASLGFLAPVATLRYELAIPIPGPEEEAREVGLASLWASMGIGLLVLLVLAAARTLELTPLADVSRAFLVGLPLGVAVSGVYQTLTYWAVRHDHFRSIAWARGSLGTGTSVVQILLGLFPLGPLGLIGGDLGGRIGASGFLGRSLASTLKGGKGLPSPRAVVHRARAFKGFALISCPSALMNSLALFLPLFAVGHLYGAAAAGMLFLAQRVVGLPATLLTSATAQVYIGEFTKIDEADRVSLYDRTLGRLAVLSVLPFLVGAVAAPPLFPIIFGAEWATAGRMAMLVAPYYFFQLLSGATVSTLDTMELHLGRLFREATFLCLIVGVFTVPFLVEIDLLKLVGIYGVVGSVFYLGSVVFVRVLMARALS